MNAPLLSYSAAARALGVRRETISDLVGRYQIKTRPLPKRGKGLDPAAMQTLGRVLRIPATAAAS